MNYTSLSRDSGITHDQFLSLFDDTRHLASPVATCKLGIDDAVAVATRPRLVNLDTAASQIDNSAEIAALLGDIDDIIAATAYLDEPEAQIESTPAATVALAVPDVVEVSEKSVTIDCLMPSIAPAFRAYPALPAPNSGRAFTAADDENLIRQIVADLKWLHEHDHRPAIDSPKYRNMMTGDKLDIALTEQFAREKWSADHRVGLLVVPEYLEFQMAQLCGKATKMKRLRVRRDRLKIAAKLSRSITEPEHAKHVEKWTDIAVCMELVGDSPSAIARLYTAMTGERMSDDNARKRRNEIKARLGKK